MAVRCSIEHLYRAGTTGNSPIYDIAASLAPALKTTSDEFLNSEGDKNDYEW